MNTTFTPQDIESFYRVLFSRRDVRRFRADAVSEALLERILRAAHHAPSVGFMQPWTFIVIRSAATKQRVKEAFVHAHAAEAEQFSGDRKTLYLSLKLEGIEEAPVNLCITCDPTRQGPAVLGRSQAPETDIYSTCCAIENLWLAARAEGLGVGWVSIVSGARLKDILAIPAHVVPVAYLCLGYAERFEEKPELETAGWLDRLPLENVIVRERWHNSTPK